MIQKVSVYKASDNSTHETLEGVKEQEIFLILTKTHNEQTKDAEELFKEHMRHAAQKLLNNSAETLNILTTKESSLPAARSVNGGRKPRKKTPTAPALNQEGVTP